MFWTSVVTYLSLTRNLNESRFPPIKFYFFFQNNQRFVIYRVKQLASSNLPNKESSPQASHTQKLTPTEPVLTSNPDGDTNIPDPIKTKNERHLISNIQFDRILIEFVPYQSWSQQLEQPH